MPALNRFAPALLLAALLLPASLPAFAGSAETALLGKYAGVWAGGGELTGVGKGSLTCSLTMKPTKTGALGYSGRCAGPAGSTSFRGTLAYDDKTSHFIATSSAAGIDSTVIGKKQGSGIAFEMTATKTPMGPASSTLSLSGKTIKIAFKLQEKKGLTSSNITFTKS